MSTGWDLTSTVSYVGNFSVSSQETLPTGVTFGDSGTKMYVTGRNNDSIYQYNLSSAYTITSGVSHAHTLDVSAGSIVVPNGLINPHGISISSDGTKIWVIDPGEDIIIQINLGTAYDLSTATYSNDLTNIYWPTSTGYDLYIDESAEKGFVLFAGNIDSVREIDIATSGLLIEANPTSRSANINLNNNVQVKGKTWFEDTIIVNGSQTSFFQHNLQVQGTLTCRGVVDLADGPADRIQFGGTDDAKIYYDGTANYFDLQFSTADNNGFRILDSSSSELFRVAKDGNVAIGTDSPTAKLDVRGGLNVTGVSTFQDDVFLGDNDKINLGDGDDLQIYHESSTGDSVIREIGGGNLRLGGTDVEITSPAGSETYATFNTNGSVELYYDNSKKFETTDAGVIITGIATATSFVKSGGTSSQFLKADGSVDSSTYLTSFTETNDLSSAVTWANVPNANITESSVTQHQAALSITESQISDLQSYLTSYTETQTLNDVLSLGNTSSTGLSVGVVTATALKGFDYLQAPHGSTVNFSVTVAAKTAAHRYNGSGSSNGYLIDGVESPFLTFTPGRTYRFTLSSSDMSSHPFRFYLEADKTTAYTTNVTSTATYTEIVVTDTTPTVLHYQCSAHGYMGNAVQVNSNKINTPYQIDGLSGANITGVVTATSFSGTATNASNVTLADESSDTICYPTFSTDPTGNQALKTDQSNLLYNSSTGSLSAASFSGDGSTLNNVLSNLSEDETPQLGGGLDLNGSDITGSGHIDITGNLDVSGISSVGTAITMYGSTGIVSATQFYGDGSNLSSIVTQLTAGTGISLNQTTGNVTITATGGGGDAEPTTRTTSRFVATASQSTFTVSYNVGYVDVFLNGIKLDSTEYTATNGSSVSLTSAAAEDDIIEIVAFESVGITSITSATKGLDVTGHLETDTLNVSGIATITGGIDAIGIQSGGVNIATGPITPLTLLVLEILFPSMVLQLILVFLVVVEVVDPQLGQ